MRLAGGAVAFLGTSSSSTTTDDGVVGGTTSSSSTSTSNTDTHNYKNASFLNRKSSSNRRPGRVTAIGRSRLQHLRDDTSTSTTIIECDPTADTEAVDSSFLEERRLKEHQEEDDRTILAAATGSVPREDTNTNANAKTDNQHHLHLGILSNDTSNSNNPQSVVSSSSTCGLGRHCTHDTASSLGGVCLDIEEAFNLSARSMRHHRRRLHRPQHAPQTLAALLNQAEPPRQEHLTRAPHTDTTRHDPMMLHQYRYR